MAWDWFVCLRRFLWYAYWHSLLHLMSYGMCHKMSKNGILWHFMTFQMTCHMTLTFINHGNMGIKRTVLNWQIDLRPLELSIRNKIWKNIKKTENPIFPLYFSPNPFVKWKCKLRCGFLLESQDFCVFSLHCTYKHLFNPGFEYSWQSGNFGTPYSYVHADCVDVWIFLHVDCVDVWIIFLNSWINKEWLNYETVW